MSRGAAALIALVALAAGLASEHVRQVWLQPLWVPVIDLGVGWLLVGCGLVAAVARPNQPAGRRLVLAGSLWIVGAPRQWFGGTGRTDDFIQLDAVSFTLVGWSDAVIAFIALAYAGRLPARRRDLMIVGALVAAYSFQTFVRFLNVFPDLFGVDVLNPDGSGTVLAIADVLRTSLLGVAGLLIAQRWLATRGSSRRLLGPVLLAGAASCLVPLYGIWFPLSQLGFIDPVPESLAVPSFWLTNAVRVLVPIAMLFGILRQRVSRLAMTDVIADVGRTPSAVELEAALARALGDPSLRVLSWDATQSAFLDVDGRPTPLPPDGDPQTVTPISGQGRPIAALVHDRSLAEDPTLVAVGVAVTRLVIDNENLNRELRQQLDEVTASRARIVDAGDAERRRIERDLHDGVQQRLLALALSLRRAGVAITDDPAAAEALGRGADEALGVVSDVRDLAQGIHPAALTEAGLATALQALASRSPVPVELDIGLDGRASPGASATAYFVASEALANVVKHASAAIVQLRASSPDGEIRVTVEDDGRGGADPFGPGLRGLSDRVSAIGGRLTVEERAGGGTVVTAVIPAR